MYIVCIKKKRHYIAFKSNNDDDSKTEKNIYKFLYIYIMRVYIFF